MRCVYIEVYIYLNPRVCVRVYMCARVHVHANVCANSRHTHTVLSIEDCEFLRGMVQSIIDKILEHMSSDEFDRVGKALDDLDKIEMVDDDAAG